ncbi:MAG: hypothetical protein ACM3YO_05055 [Bacteroidota bacterium]
MIDNPKEIERLTKENVNQEGERGRLEGQLKNEQFVSKAPAAVVDKLRNRKSEVEGQLNALLAQIERLR